MGHHGTLWDEHRSREGVGVQNLGNLRQTGMSWDAVGYLGRVGSPESRVIGKPKSHRGDAEARRKPTIGKGQEPLKPTPIWDDWDVMGGGGVIGTSGHRDIGG